MEDIITLFHPRHLIKKYDPYLSIYDEPICIICEKKISSRSTHFSCLICDIFFHKECPAILMGSTLTLNHPETHAHTLTFIRKKNSFNCDACGKVDDDKMNMYVCLQCNFFVHRNCIYLPKLIKLTRHSHRLFQTFHVSDWNAKCRICDYPFAHGCGGYICVDKECDYKLHSYCATDPNVWDGIDVANEKEPEETSNSEEDGGGASSSLEEVDGKIVRHFIHHHDLMRLRVNDEEEEDGRRVCQACILPIDFDGFLGCKECEFTLHETCASLPRKMEHTLHRHQLILEVKNEEGFFKCSKCERESCGFMYRCCQEECGFKMDAKCASLVDPLYYGPHQHPLILTDSGAKCHECSLLFSFKQATLPVLVKYKHDTHPLALCFTPVLPPPPPPLLSPLHFRSRIPPRPRPRPPPTRPPLLQFMLRNPPSLDYICCDICEVEISKGDPNYRHFYNCADCNTTLHVECVIGKHPYLKPGHTIKVNGFEYEIASNSLSRPICHACHRICQDKLIFKNIRDVVFFCSVSCIIIPYSSGSDNDEETSFSSFSSIVSEDEESDRDQGK